MQKGGGKRREIEREREREREREGEVFHRWRGTLQGGGVL
jgi:hypothetical protein